MIVDIHAHYFAKEYIDLLMSIGGRSVPEAARALTAGQLRRDDVAGVAARLSPMDEAGVQVQGLFPAPRPPDAEKESDAAAAAAPIHAPDAREPQKNPG